MRSGVKGLDTKNGRRVAHEPRFPPDFVDVVALPVNRTPVVPLPLLSAAASETCRSENSSLIGRRKIPSRQRNHCGRKLESRTITKKKRLRDRQDPELRAKRSKHTTVLTMPAVSDQEVDVVQVSPSARSETEQWPGSGASKGPYDVPWDTKWSPATEWETSIDRTGWAGQMEWHGWSKSADWQKPPKKHLVTKQGSYPLSVHLPKARSTNAVPPTPRLVTKMTMHQKCRPDEIGGARR